MNEPGDQQRVGNSSSVNPKIASDSGYGSNKSTQRSSGSSKSHESSMSSESGAAFPPHPNAISNESQSSPSQGGSTKRQGKKKKNDRKMSVGEKPEAWLSSENTKESNKSGNLPQSMDQSGNSNGNTSSTAIIGSQQQQQMSQSQIQSPGSKISSAHDSKALQMAALTHALSCMKKFHKPRTDSEIDENVKAGTSPGKKWQDYFPNEEININDNCNDTNFGSVVSLEDGIIVYITPSISNILGFPKDMLVGRSFIDFVHPKDRMAFASHITCGMSFPMSDQHSSQSQGSNNTGGAPRLKSESFYCRLRQYRGLKTVGFGVVDKTILYHPFKLTMSLKKVEQTQKDINISGVGTNSATSCATSVSEAPPDCDNGNNTETGDGGNDARMGSIPSKKSNFPNPSLPNTNVHLVIVASRIKSAYQYSDEIPVNAGKFVTRHSASCHFGHMDSDAINYLGHLPQDLIGNSVLDYYHPEDMGLMKDIYAGVMHEQGKPFRSKPYRFRVFNGTFAMLETDWSCFINPWSWKLEFVIGQHRVVKGPGNPNVFLQPNSETDYMKNAPEEIINESKENQNEIKKLLTEVRKGDHNTAVTRRLSDPLRQQSSRRRKDLAAVMESLLERIQHPENSDKCGSQCSGMCSVMERDSVMLGEISPHHDDQSGSNQSSETPPSYYQLNYKENIERFFQSQPKTIRSDESPECSKIDTDPSANRSSDSDSKCSPNLDYTSGSNVMLSSSSNENDSVDRELCTSPLTEERLSRHNEAMEKFMIQRHREQRGKSSMTPGSYKDSLRKHSEKYDISHGVKRTGNPSWDGDHARKQPHLECSPFRNQVPLAASNRNNGPGQNCCPGQNKINLWPPFSIAMTPGVVSSTYRSVGNIGGGVPGHYPGVSHGHGYNPNRPGQETFRSASNHMPETISMQTATSSAPFLFVPNQQHQQQFSPHVQLLTGVVYQPLGSCVYGPPTPSGFLGTMIHPNQPGGQMGLGQGPRPAAPKPVMPLPKSFDKDRHGLYGHRQQAMKNLTTFINSPMTVTAGPSKAITSKSAGYKGRMLPHPKECMPMTSRKSVSAVVNHHVQHLDATCPDGSCSDESMNSSSMNTKDESMSNSDVDHDAPMWNRRKEHSSGMRPRPVRNKLPPWLEKVQMTPDLTYRYRVPTVDLSKILQKDLEALKIFGKQSTMVNDQLGMLYNELELGKTLNLEEGMTSSSSSDENLKNIQQGTLEGLQKKKKAIGTYKYNKMVILYEENAPFPPEAPKTQKATTSTA